jgi:putative flippase GtrA
LIKHFLSRQFLAFLAAGVAAAMVHWLSRIALSVWLAFPVAVALAYAVGILTAFLLNAWLVFPSSNKPRAQQARDFVLVNLLFFPVVWGASVAIERLLRAWSVPQSQAVAHGLAISIPTLATFLLYKFFTFKERPLGHS